MDQNLRLTDLPTILVINGPNLNLLGSREPEKYGTTSYEQLKEDLLETGLKWGYHIECKQSNHEGKLLDWIHEAQEQCVGLIINPGAYGHTSIALRDALAAVALPAIEVHITQTAKRESFRHHTYLSEIVLGTLTGFGVYGYHLAVQALHHTLSHH